MSGGRATGNDNPSRSVAVRNCRRIYDHVENRRQIEAGELACRLLNLYFEQRSGAFLCGDQQVRKRKPAKPLICWWVRCGSALNANWLGNSFALPLPPVATEAQSTPLALA